MIGKKWLRSLDDTVVGVGEERKGQTNIDIESELGKIMEVT